MARTKILLDNSEGKGFSKRLFTRSYAVDRTGKEMLGYPPNYRKGDIFYGHDAILQSLDESSGAVLDQKSVIIQHHPHDEGFLEWSSGFNENPSQGVTDLVVIHPADGSEPFMYLPSNPDLDAKIEEVIRPIHKTIDVGEDYMERSFYGFKLYQLIIIGLVGIVIIK
tara:strand:- start:1031 stop:1531 length:501 start_codon:yes stop_codon:yes gene_type:complete